MRVPFLIAVALAVAATARATDRYDPATQRLSMPSVAIGDATYSDVVVTVGGVVSGPGGTSATVAGDSYDPAARQVTVAAVALNQTIYYNVVATVTGLVSIGGVAGADSFDGVHLTIPAVQVGSGPVYNDAVVTVGRIVSTGGGLPQAAFDVYDPTSGQLTLAAIQLGGTVYTNPVIVPGTIVSTGRPAGHFAYVANGGDGTISGYSIDASSGAFTALPGSPFPVPGSSQLWEIKVDPSGRFLYVLDYGAQGVYGFAVNRSSGALTPLNAGAPFTSGVAPQSMTFDATGAYAYVANLEDDDIAAFALDPLSGRLTALRGSPYPISGTLPTPEQIVRAGNYLYVADYDVNSVDVFVIDPSTGALREGVPGSPFLTDTHPYSLAVDPSGSVLYTANAGDDNGSVSAYRINAANGALEPVSGNPLAIPANQYVTIDPQGRFLLVAEDTAIGVYPIDLATGAVGSPVAGSPFAAGTNPNIAVVDPTDRFVYAGNDGSANVSEYTFNATSGVLTPMTGSPVAAGSEPDFIAID